jgi:hypothetical protein
MKSGSDAFFLDTRDFVYLFECVASSHQTSFHPSEEVSLFGHGGSLRLFAPSQERISSLTSLEWLVRESFITSDITIISKALLGRDPRL